MKVIVKGETKEMNYEEICHALGLEPETKIAHVTPGIRLPNRLYNVITSIAEKITKARKGRRSKVGYRPA